MRQRVVKDAVQVGAVIVVADSDRVREALTPVYAALGLDWRPETTGALTDEDPAIEWDRAYVAVREEYAASYALRPAELDEETLALASELAPAHRS